MQTFVPEPDLMKSVRALDDRRLGKQRVETLQILNALVVQTTFERPRGWLNHPATLMWKHHISGLTTYGLAAMAVWSMRGFNNGDDLLWKMKFIRNAVSDGMMKPRFPQQSGMPSWFGREDVHRSHRITLLSKAERDFAFRGSAADEKALEHYRKLGWSEQSAVGWEYSYVWPTDEL